MSQQFKPIENPSMFGYYLNGPDDTCIEVVRCYAGQWDVFVTRDSNVVACIIERHKGNMYLSFKQARSMARRFVKE